MYSTLKSHPHSCTKIYSPRLSTAEAKRILEENRPLMQLSVADSRQTIQVLAGGQISYRSLVRARTGVTQDLDERGMGKLRSYIRKFTETNPGSTCEVEIDEQHKLNHQFICPSISRDVFRSALPLICLDATHSLNLSTHKIYTAVTVDCALCGIVLCSRRR